MSAALDLLLDEAAISRLIGRYATVVDWLSWDQLPSIFTPDARFDFGGMFQGDLTAFGPFVAALEEGYDRRMHMFGLPRIDVTGDTARAECANVTHTRNKGEEAHADALFLGHYVFDAERQADGGWKLTRLSFYLNAVHGSQQPPMDETAINVADNLNPAHPDAPKL